MNCRTSPLAHAALALLLAACGEDSADRTRAPLPEPGHVFVPSEPDAVWEPPPMEPHEWSGQGCTRTGCHGGIEPIREPSTEMMQEIFALGAEVGDRDGCVVCHGGTPDAETAELAHAGTIEALAARHGPDDFFPDPASPWVNARSCGPCHADHVRAQWSSLMMTEAGKIQGTAWSFGGLEGTDHVWGNYDYTPPTDAQLADEPPALRGDHVSDPHNRLGTDAYRAYMAVKQDAHANVFPDRQDQVPEAPSDVTLDQLSEHPEQAAFTYIRAECQRCHLGVRGRSRRGDYRGMGCSACHIPYGNEGLYEGGDESVPTEEAGHLLVHRIQGTRGATVEVHGERYTGIPVETCTTCHNRGKRIGVSYQGLMESAYNSPFTEGGGGQLDLHSKHYISMTQDVHFQAGMLCQDCHTSLDVHGDGQLAGTNLAAVEIECSDCHGTPDNYPWELPLGYGDENGPGPAEGAARGVATELPAMLRQGHVPPVQDGYLLSARGNPMPDIVRDGNEVIVHTVGGRDLRLRPLPLIAEGGDGGVDFEVAMVHVDQHVRTMECYACHTQWAPQCYGCHIQIDYSGDNRSFDWVAAGNEHLRADRRTARGESGFGTTIPGEVTETRSYLRWENPPLGVNGEGRVTPLIPGCQTTVTVIGPDGRELLRNYIYRTPGHTEGAGEEGQLAIDMSPVQPHTVGPARSCASCHESAQALGYGIGGGLLNRSPGQDTMVDLMTADGRILPHSARPQIEAINGLTRDWSALVTPGGQQLQTVGHHFEGSGPLSDLQRRHMDRRGTCSACHQEIPDASAGVSLLHHVAEMAGRIPDDRVEHASLLDKIALSSAWAQILGVLGAVLALIAGGAYWLRRWRAQ